MSKFYFAHKENVLVNDVEDFDCVIKTDKNWSMVNKFHIVNADGSKETFCIHNEITECVNINPANPERLRFECDNDKEDLVFDVIDFHPDNFNMTIFRKIAQ